MQVIITIILLMLFLTLVDRLCPPGLTGATRDLRLNASEQGSGTEPGGKPIPIGPNFDPHLTFHQISGASKLGIQTLQEGISPWAQLGEERTPFLQDVPIAHCPIVIQMDLEQESRDISFQGEALPTARSAELQGPRHSPALWGPGRL